MNIVLPSVEWFNKQPHPELLIKEAGMTCYKSESKLSAPDFVRMLVKKKHASVLEHVSAGFRVVSDRGVSHEFVRHRVGIVFSQESTRYCNYSDDRFGNEISVIEPPGLTTEQQLEWKGACEVAEFHYMNLLQEKCSPQIARSVLPTCLKTEYVVTANFTAWRHILKLRSKGEAGTPHPQMKEIADKILAMLVDLCPAAFEDLL